MNVTDKPKSLKRTAVAMSGGVDSSVAAALLKNEGHDILGVTFVMFEEDGSDEKGGVAERAKRVADSLDIPHKTVIINDLFNKKVISYFVEEYLNGRTPIPCVVCNKLVKFSRLISLAEMKDCRFIATGHYARIVKRSGGFLLKKGIDEDRDQSFFLSRLGQDELKRTIFPLGEMVKGDVMKIASSLKLPVTSGESREICFVFKDNGNDDYRSFIEKRIEEDCVDGGGEIVDLDGKILGGHNGYYHFTVGQRRGIGISSKEPLYVVRIDAKTKRVVVGKRDALYERRVSAVDFNWISGEAPKEREIRAMAMIRYNQSPGWGTATIEEKGKVTFNFDEPQFAPAPGQILAVYDNDIILGGGFIL